MKSEYQNKRCKFIFLFFCLIFAFASCQTYYVSVDTLKNEFSLKNNTIKHPKMINITGKTKNGTTKIISLKPNETIVVELKSEKVDTVNSLFSYLRKYPNTNEIFGIFIK